MSLISSLHAVSLSVPSATPSLLNTHCETTVYIKYFKILASRAALRKGTPEKTDGSIRPRKEHRGVQWAPRGPPPLAIGAAIHAPPIQTRPVRNAFLLENNCLIQGWSDHRSACLSFRHCTPSLCPYLPPLPLSVTRFHFVTHSLPGCPSITFAVTYSPLVTQLSHLER